MATCEVRGNDYDKAFHVSMPDETTMHVFDSFECAIHALAPQCADCGCKVIGHGTEADGSILRLCPLCAAGGSRRRLRPELRGLAA